ncbi:unnamed protein product [Dibothriocephalus latus]|uniref:Uncharacterized protein n=1 Tax=Dibothriocephalus latus TaxID=60516 RepID=A0A3P6TXH0_DIBLA|nr:unnamed protein product [Dibothriocephalus latus]
MIQTVLVSSLPYLNASIGGAIQSLHPENLPNTLSELNNSDYLDVVVSVIKGSSSLADGGGRNTLLNCLMQADIEDITLQIGALMDDLLQALGISLLLSPPADNASISHSPAANLLSLIAFVVFRISSGHPEWMEEETQRNRLLCSYLTGTSGLTDTAGMTDKCLPVELLHLITGLLTDRADFLRHIFPWSAWFFLELLMRTYIQETVQSRALIIGRHAFREDLLVLTAKIAKYVCSRLEETITDSGGATVVWADALTQPDIRRHLSSSLANEISLNRSFAFFLCDAFGCINTVFLYQQISTYLDIMDKRIHHLSTVDKQEDSDLISPKAANELRCLVFLKLEFLQIVSSNRDFVTLSLPVDNHRFSQLKTISDVDFLRSIPPNYSILQFPVYRTVHFLPYLVLSEVYRCLASHDVKIQEQSMGLLWFCIRNLENNPHNVHLFDRSFASGLPDATPLYLPLLEVACDLAPGLLAYWLQGDEMDGNGGHKHEGGTSSTLRQAGSELASEASATDDREQLRPTGFQTLRKQTNAPQAAALGRESSRTRRRLSSSELRDECASSPVGTNASMHFQSILPHFSFYFKREPNTHQDWSLDSIQRLLLLVLWVLHQCRDTILAEWMLRTGMEMIERLNSLLIMALHYFEYKVPIVNIDTQMPSPRLPNLPFLKATFSNQRLLPEFTPAPIKCTKSPGTSMTQTPSSSVRGIILEPPSWQSSHLHKSCVENRKLLAKTVVSIVCNTLELITVIFLVYKFYFDAGIVIIVHLLLFSKLAFDGFCRFRWFSVLAHRFPKFFFDEYHALTFSVCYVLLPFCSSPLPKIRAMVTAVFYQMFRQCYLLHKHLFFLSCEMTLGIQLHLYGDFQILDDIRTWLKNVDDEMEGLQKRKHLTGKGICANDPWSIRSIETVPMVIMVSFYHLLEQRAAPQGRYLQAAFNSLKAYAKSDMAVDIEQRQLEGLQAHQRHIFRSPCTSGLQYVVLTSQFHATGGFYAQLSVSIEIWMEIVACLQHLQRFLTPNSVATATEREHTLNLTDIILRMATASRLVPELRQNWLLRLAEINLLVSGASTIADQVMSANLLEECSVEAAIGLPTVPPCSRFFLRSSMSGLDGDERSWDSQQSLSCLIGQLQELVEKTVDCLMAADQFEIVTLLCHWLMPILASLGHHQRLAKIHELVGATHTAATASALYIQITYVEPYYSQSEARQKATIFGRNYGISKLYVFQH